MKKIVYGVLAILIVQFSLCTYTYAADTSGGSSTAVATVAGPNVSTYYTEDPSVPSEVVSKGRQAVAEFLLGSIDAVYVGYSGASIVAPNSQYFSLSDLRRMGYVHRGLFSELSDAISSTTFSQSVVPTPDGRYDVNVYLTFYMTETNSNGQQQKIAFYGASSLNITRDPSGNLTAGNFDPWIYFNPNIDVKIQGNLNAAKWVGANGQSYDLGVHSFDSNNSVISISDSQIGNGQIIYSDYQGNAFSLNMITGSTIAGKNVRAILGRLYSSEVRILVEPPTIDAGNSIFYQSSGQVYGRFPLTDLLTGLGMNSVISFQVPVWGSNMKVAPSHIYVTPIWMNVNGLPSTFPYHLGQESELPYDNTRGGWILNVPQGGYHIRIKFDNVLDWNADTNARG